MFSKSFTRTVMTEQGDLQGRHRKGPVFLGIQPLIPFLVKHIALFYLGMLSHNLARQYVKHC